MSIRRVPRTYRRDVGRCARRRLAPRCSAAYHRAAPILTPLEIGFAQDMSAHHQQAVTMTDMLAADASPR